MKKFTSSLLIVFLGLTLPYHGGSHSHAAEDTAMMCHIPSSAGGHDHHAMMSKTMAVMAQDPDQQQPSPPPHQPSKGVGCSRPHPNDPEKGVEPNTIACHCVKKLPCNNNEPQEDPGTAEDDYKTRCKNWCFKFRCSCPNPCKS